MSVNLAGAGHNESVDLVAIKTLAEADYGVVQNVMGSYVITLPATVVGATFLIRVGAPGLTVAVSPAAADKIMGNGFTSADNKDLIFTDQPAGSYVQLVGDGVNGYMVQRVKGTATKEA
jgi:hypothetical protein